MVLPFSQGGGVEADHKAKVILEPPIAVAVNGELTAVKIDLDGQDAVVPEGMDALLVRSIFQAHSADVRRCYEGHRPSVPEGSVVVSFSLDGAGRVTDASVLKDDFKKGDLGECVVSRVWEWGFSRSSVPGRVAFPIRFGR